MLYSSHSRLYGDDLVTKQYPAVVPAHLIFHPVFIGCISDITSAEHRVSKEKTLCEGERTVRPIPAGEDVFSLYYTSSGYSSQIAFPPYLKEPCENFNFR